VPPVLGEKSTNVIANHTFNYFNILPDKETSNDNRKINF